MKGMGHEDRRSKRRGGSYWAMEDLREGQFNVVSLEAVTCRS